MTTAPSITSSAIGDNESFDVFNPDMSVVTPERLARVLSHLCRFNGHTPFHYSVAQHSFYCAREIIRQTGDAQLALEALMHDAAEAFLADIPRPIKYSAGFDVYRSLDDDLTEQIFAHFGLRYPLHQDVKEADNRMLLTERRELQMTGGGLWPDGEPYEDMKIARWSPSEAAEEWLGMFTSLAARLEGAR
jgi:hypothetical protein